MLNVVGTASTPRFAESAGIVQSWFPAARRCDVPGATHLLVAQHPVIIARDPEAFWRRISR